MHNSPNIASGIGSLVSVGQSHPAHITGILCLPSFLFVTLSKWDDQNFSPSTWQTGISEVFFRQIIVIQLVKQRKTKGLFATLSISSSSIDSMYSNISIHVFKFDIFVCQWFDWYRFLLINNVILHVCYTLQFFVKQIMLYVVLF